MDFRIRGLEPGAFSTLHHLRDEELAAHHAVRRVADSKPGFPCRVTLEDAEPGERVLLLNYEHLPVETPYRSRHAIFVREAARRPYDATNAMAPALAGRLLALRAFDAQGSMVDAEIVEGAHAPGLIGKFFGDARVAYLHAHFARRGCFAARIDRA